MKNNCLLVDIFLLVVSTNGFMLFPTSYVKPKLSLRMVESMNDNYYSDLEQRVF